MHGEVDDHADIRHPRRKRPDAGDRDRKNIFARYRLLDGGDRRIETLDMADHQRHPGAAGGGDDVPPFFHRGRDRLLDHDVDVLRDAGERDLVVKMGWRCDGDGIDPLRDQFV